MKDILIPIGLLLFIGIFVYAFISTARKQKGAKADAFRDFAREKGFAYQEEDDGKAREFAKDFDGIGQFSSPSLGEMIPTDVVTGEMGGREIILFHHSTRFAEGWAREWFVAGITSNDPLAERCSIQFCTNESQKDTIYLQGNVVKELQADPFKLIVRASDPVKAGRVMNEEILVKLADLARELPMRPEIQIRGDRLAVYPGGRNATVEDVDTLDALLRFARQTEAVL